MSENRLLHFFPGADLRCSHDGLKLLAKKKKVDLSNMKMGDCVIFMNNAGTKLKMFASGTKCLMFVSNDGRKIAPETIQFLPQYVQGGELNYRGALKEAIETFFARRGKKRGN